MVDFNPIHQHWKKHQKDFNNNLKQLQQRLNTDSIHDIRVATKKLRAILKLYNLINTEADWNYLFLKTDILFDTLGKYRDIEICISLITVLEKEKKIRFNELRAYLNAMLKMIRGWVNQEIHRYHPKELPRIGLLLKQDNSLSDNEKFLQLLSQIIQANITTIKKSINEPHKVRKSLKEIYYWLSFFPEEQIKDLWHYKELQDILDEYGTWQDNEVLEIRIKHFRKDFLPKSNKEYPQLKEIQIHIQEIKQQLLNSANGKLKKWMKKVQVAVKEQSKV